MPPLITKPTPASFLGPASVPGAWWDRLSGVWVAGFDTFDRALFPPKIAVVTGSLTNSFLDMPNRHFDAVDFPGSANDDIDLGTIETLADYTVIIVAVNDAMSNLRTYFAGSSDLWVSSAGAVTFRRPYTTTAGQWNDGGTMNTGDEYMVVITHDGTSTAPNIWRDLNGVRIDTKIAMAQAAAPSGTVDNLNGEFHIGNFDSSLDRPFNGRVALLYVWRRILADAEIEDVFRDPYVPVRTPPITDVLIAAAATGPTLVNLSGTQPAATGSIGAQQTLLRAVAGTQPAATGTLGAQQTLLRSLAGTQPAATGTISAQAITLVSVSGAQPAPSGSLSLTAFIALAGIQPAATGSIALLAMIGLAGTQPAATGALSLSAFIALAGTQPAATGTILGSAVGATVAFATLIARQRHLQMNAKERESSFEVKQT